MFVQHSCRGAFTPKKARTQQKLRFVLKTEQAVACHQRLQTFNTQFLHLFTGFPETPQEELRNLLVSLHKVLVLFQNPNNK